MTNDLEKGELGRSMEQEGPNAVAMANATEPTEPLLKDPTMDAEEDVDYVEFLREVPRSSTPVIPVFDDDDDDDEDDNYSMSDISEDDDFVLPDLPDNNGIPTFFEMMDKRNQEIKLENERKKAEARAKKGRPKLAIPFRKSKHISRPKAKGNRPTASTSTSTAIPKRVERDNSPGPPVLIDETKYVAQPKVKKRSSEHTVAETSVRASNEMKNEPNVKTNQNEITFTKWLADEDVRIEKPVAIVKKFLPTPCHSETWVNDKKHNQQKSTTNAVGSSPVKKQLAKAEKCESATSESKIVDIGVNQKGSFKDKVKKSTFSKNSINSSPSPAVNLMEPSKMATFELLSNTSVLMAGMNILNKLCSKHMSTDEAAIIIGLKKKGKSKSKPDFLISSSFSTVENPEAGTSAEEKTMDVALVPGPSQVCTTSELSSKIRDSGRRMKVAKKKFPRKNVVHQTNGQINKQSETPECFSFTDFMNKRANKLRNGITDDESETSLFETNDLEVENISDDEMPSTSSRVKSRKRPRSVSPDICAFVCTETKKRLAALRQKKRLEKASAANESSSGSDSSDSDENSAAKYGESLFKELVGRTCGAGTLSQELPTIEDLERMLDSDPNKDLYPQYEEKCAVVQGHSEKVHDLSIESLTEHFVGISPQLKQIFDDSLPSKRHQLYLGGPSKLYELKRLNLSGPFASEHFGALIQLLFDLLVPDLDERPVWSEYLSYVMLPESLIRIFARVNQISYKLAEIELRFGACYDGPLIVS